MVEMLKNNDVENIKKSASDKQEVKDYKPFVSNKDELKDELPDLDEAYGKRGSGNKKGSKEVADSPEWEKDIYKRDGKDIYFRDINEYYDIKSHSYKYYKIEDADASTFVSLGEYYAQDKNKSYYKGQEILGGGKNLVIAVDGYAKDENNVYYNGQKIDGVSPDTFDPNSFSQVDLSEFNMFNEYPSYYKDENNVYYDGKLVSTDAKNFRYSGMIYRDGYSIDIYALNASKYFKDSENTYLNGEKVPSNIEFFGDNGLMGFVRVDDKIYYETGSAAPLTEKEVIGVDAESFHSILPSSTDPDYEYNNINQDMGVFQDKNNKYYSSNVFGKMPRIVPLNK